MKQRISNKAHNSIFWREEYLKKNISYLGSGHAWLACKISLCKNNKLQNLPTEWMALNNSYSYSLTLKCHHVILTYSFFSVYALWLKQLVPPETVPQVWSQSSEFDG